MFIFHLEQTSKVEFSTSLTLNEWNYTYFFHVEQYDQFQYTNNWYQWSKESSNPKKKRKYHNQKFQKSTNDLILVFSEMCWRGPS